MTDTIKTVAVHNVDPKLWTRIKVAAFKAGVPLSAYAQQLWQAALNAK